MRVPGIIAAVLAGVVVSAMLMGNVGDDGGSGPPGRDTPSTSVTDPDDSGGGGHRPSGGH
jgi:hypothetical protein